jgi:hypothetical protein
VVVIQASARSRRLAGFVARTISGSLAVAVAFAGCQPAAPATSAPASASRSSGGPPSGAALPTSRPGSTGATPGGGTPFPSLLSLELDASGPFIRPGDGPPGYSYALPAAATRDRDGNIVLFIVWFGEGDADIRITVSMSADGVAWDVGTEPITGSLAIGVPDPGPIPTAVHQLDDGSWVLYGWASDDERGTSLSSWRATAPEPEGPWTLDATRILGSGVAGAWDSYMAVAGSAQRFNGEWLMWYEGEGPGEEVRGEIGLATSPDGITWRKHDDPATTDLARATSDPVLALGICGEGTGQALEQPQVEPRADGLVAVFGGFAAAGEQMDLYGAVSTDGRSWQCGSPELLLRTQDIPGSGGIHTIASVALADGRIGVIIESLSGEQSELWWATVEAADAG